MTAPKHETIAEMWAGFAAAVLPPDCPAVQRTEMRRAFYAGFWALLMAAFRTIGADEVSEEDGVARLEQWKAEHEQFQRDLQEGRA